MRLPELRPLKRVPWLFHRLGCGLLRGSPRYARSDHLDAAVGFGAAKGDAKMDQAMANLGHGHAAWAYQGSRPFVSRGRLCAAHGDLVSCADPRSDVVYWKKPLGAASAGEGELLDSPLTPPAIANGKLFFGSVHGVVHCLSAEAGEEPWAVSVGEPVVFQPAVAGGRVYAASEGGSLYCLETGDRGDDGWLIWGGDAADNGRLESERVRQKHC
jgi:outer membrane protein assembly factor BamB